MVQAGEEEAQRKRLHYRSWHRGTREMDLLMGSFADRYLTRFSAAELAAYEALLERSDPDLFGWLSRSSSDLLPGPLPEGQAAAHVAALFKAFAKQREAGPDKKIS